MSRRRYHQLKMGLSNSVPDKRSQSHKSIEKSMDMQLCIPHKEFCVPPDIKILSIGHFRGGEFQPIANLTVNSLLHANLEIHQRTSPIKSMKEITRNNERSMVVLDEETVIYEVYPYDLNLMMNEKTIDRRLYEIDNELYIVHAVYKSTGFKIIDQDLTNSQNSGYIEYNQPNIPKVYGYRLMRYKVTSNGTIKLVKDNNKLY
jgi:hypothetical protein